MPQLWWKLPIQTREQHTHHRQSDDSQIAATTRSHLKPDIATTCLQDERLENGRPRTPRPVKHPSGGTASWGHTDGSSITAGLLWRRCWDFSGSEEARPGVSATETSGGRGAAAASQARQQRLSKAVRWSSQKCCCHLRHCRMCWYSIGGTLCKEKLGEHTKLCSLLMDRS